MSGGDFKDMFAAAVRGDVELVRFHLERGVDPDYVHPELQSTALVTSILAGQDAVARELLGHGADPTLVSELDETTPVAAARAAGLTALEAHLVELGARPAAGAPPAGPAPRGRGDRRAAWWPAWLSNSSRAPDADR
ncbi:ankyrin repeat domain-containing protein [Aeromicrobium sp. Leaf245]|uniref:ankyrin repeat domain-containing protein n=1 Tax=Aeromicrobium sp. Leaf245 TaxID=1736306 RepID=UPI0012E1BEDB|nr:ankyrin repeat domain-containing protein [Aeromicrobium sp. Leaf245]